ncbi:MAG: hypothetical protein A3F75_03380 [Betaproteobacteria bacterium RIFCSPLOWO2_12_FULL_64_23]|nr:MAG: hypothetical protein A3F75_03380 [Betaproteobacteria bacterium RIFCSPLOWO2_12_FULL_64_23]
MSASVRRHLLFWGCAMAVLVLSLMPIVPHPPTTGWDKGDHFLTFAVLTILGCRAFPAHIAAVLAGLLVYGGLIEVLQSFTPYRLAEWGDLVADSLGIIVGYALKRFSSKFERVGQPD